jgi:Xaa-Pro aminopeptidase
MREEGIGMWLVLTREGARDPMAEFFGGGHVIARTAIAIRCAEGRVTLHAVAATYDATQLADTGLYESVRTYGPEGWRQTLGELLIDAPDGRLALNISRDEPLGDGLSFSFREEILAVSEEDLTDRMVSSEPLLHELLARKTEWEVDRIARAARETDQLLRWALSPERLRPGTTTEATLAESIRREATRRGFELAWDRPLCPQVHFAADVDHEPPGERRLALGTVVRVDFGLRVDGYVADLQRTAVLLGPGQEVRPEVRQLWTAITAAVDRAAAIMTPGIPAREVDDACRAVIRSRGLEDYLHSTGHPVGYDVHDVGPMLGPNWPGRYGNRVHLPLTEGMVFTLGPSAVRVDGNHRTAVSLEEDVVVGGDEGARFLAPRQAELWIVPGRDDP